MWQRLADVFWSDLEFHQVAYVNGSCCSNLWWSADHHPVELRVSEIPVLCQPVWTGTKTALIGLWILSDKRPTLTVSLLCWADHAAKSSELRFFLFRLGVKFRLNEVHELFMKSIETNNCADVNASYTYSPTANYRESDAVTAVSSSCLNWLQAF